MNLILRNSIKQIIRTRARTILFLLLLVLAVTFLSLGINLWWSCNHNLKEYEKAFTTLGVANQKENMIKATAIWDNALQDYSYWDEPVYDSILPISVLDFEGADYIIPPKQRPYYFAYSPGIIVTTEELLQQRHDNWVSAIEFVPYEDAVPDHPVMVQVSKVIRGKVKVGDDIWVCDHSTRNPDLLKAGKRYITSGLSLFNTHPNSDPKAYYELWMYNGTVSSQTDKQGNTFIKETETTPNWLEVTDGFYDSAEGKKWLATYEADERYISYTIPVVPTDKTKLLMEFHQGEATIRIGRDITDEEYASGTKVCLVPQEMAGRNEFQLGDKINLQLYIADYKRSASMSFFPQGSSNLYYNLLNAEGTPYPVFENSDYEIVGIYHSSSRTRNPSGYETGNNVIIIPDKSVMNSDENNIADYGPMKGYTTSFQIPNGTTKSYLEKFNALGIDNLEITFYDGGYELLSTGMKNLRLVSMILLLVSGVTTLAILIFFVYMFISKQKRRTAIERSLGMSRKECTKSMLYGILGVISIGSVVGSLAGFLISLSLMSKTAGKHTELYRTEFSNWINNADKSTTWKEGVSINPWITMLPCLLVILISLGITLLYIRNNLKSEPLALLSKNEE